jgi:hypothetical protein
MKLSFKWCLVLFLLVLASWGLGHVYRAATFKLYTESPSRLIDVRGLPFKGVNPHPLDGCLRIYINGKSEGFRSDTWQTTIKWGTDLRIEWRGDDQNGFAILQGGRELMTWAIHGDQADCMSGSNLITYDPHELWMRTGSALPNSEPTK